MKQNLREQMKSAPVPKGASEAIQRRLLEQDWWASAFQVGIYCATANEPATADLIADLNGRGARVSVPVQRGGTYGWSWVEAGSRWRKGAHGIREPAHRQTAAPHDLRVVIVPGVAFDAQGGRLGHGRGHFDRLLATRDALKVGLCCENRLVESVPMEPHDIRMDMVVTEKRMIFAPTAAAKLERLLG